MHRRRRRDIEDAAHHVGEDEIDQRRTVAGRGGGDAQPRRSLLHVQGFPNVQRDAIGKPALLQILGRLRSRDDRQRAVEIALGDLVEMIAVEMREEHEVERRQIGQLDRGVGQAGGVQPAAEPGLLVLVDERRVGQDRETGDPEQHRGVADEKDRALIRRGGSRRSGSVRVLVTAIVSLLSPRETHPACQTRVAGW